MAEREPVWLQPAIGGPGAAPRRRRRQRKLRSLALGLFAVALSAGVPAAFMLPAVMYG